VTEYITVSWILAATGAIIRYWYIVSVVILLMGFTFTIRSELKLQKFLHNWKRRDWRHDG